MSQRTQLMSNAWTAKPPEVANLLNPAFCALLLREAARGYSQERNEGLPLSISFLILPIVLHGPTRRALPRAISTKMHSWIEKNQGLTHDFYLRARALVPFVRESLVFGSSGQLFEIMQQTQILPTVRRVRRLRWSSDSEASECRKRSLFLGRWLAHAGAESTIFTLWGIRP